MRATRRTEAPLFVTADQSSAMTDRERVLSALRAAGVIAKDCERFVNNTKYFGPSAFGVPAATPVLPDVLPYLGSPDDWTTRRRVQDHRLSAIPPWPWWR
jgi:hypothetical protein